MKKTSKSSEMKKKQLMFIIAAAMAAGGVSGLEERAEQGEGDGEVEILARFGEDAPMTDDGLLRTTKDYAIQIDRLSLNPEVLELSMREGAEVPRGVIELGEVIEHVGEERALFGEIEDLSALELTLNGVQVEGRVFDLEGEASRLPDEGVRISGTLPVDVTVRREKRLDLWRPGRTETVMAVDFELPVEYFDEIDWELLSLTDASKSA